MKIPGKIRYPEKIPPILSSKALNPSPDSDLEKKRKDRKHYSGKIRNHGFSGTGIRLKRSVPATPLLRWKFDDGDVSVADTKVPESGRKCRRKVRNVDGAVSVSARKLASGLWQLQQPEVHGAGEESGVLQKRCSDRLGLERDVGHAGIPFNCHHKRREFGSETNYLLQNPLSVSAPKSGILYKVEPSLSFSNSAMEGATKWDPCLKTSNEVHRFNGHVKLLEDQKITTASVVSALQAELEQARIRIHELETEGRSSKKKLEEFLRKLSEEKASWWSREHEKIRAIVDDVKDDLNREKKNRQRMEIVNSKLVNELAEAKLSMKRIMQDYEKERKAREIIEEVCDELAKEIGEDKTEVEALKRESMSIREEVEEERKMLQMAEVWREERVQLKLVDAKLTLEEKYSQLRKLIADLEAFLRLRSATPDMEMREAELLLEAASSVKIQDIREFIYKPTNSEDIFSFFEDLQNGEAKEREIDPCLGYSPSSRASKIHTVSPELNEFQRNPTQRYSNGCIDQNRDIEEDRSGWKTVSDVEEQGSSYSPEGSDPSLNMIQRDSNASGSEQLWQENAGRDTPNSEISEITSVSARQLKKSSSISRLWRPCPRNGENHKLVPIEGMNEVLSNGRISNGDIISPDCGSAQGGISPRSLKGQWSSPDLDNPHINRGLKGCIEWPLSNQKHSLKAKLLEARMESQKIQLRHVLKQKI